MKIAVIGTGYVGLVTGSCLSDVGHDVICLDSDRGKVEMLDAGRIPIYEPGLQPIVEENRKAGRLRFTTDYEEAMAHATLVFIAVGTPPEEDGSADLQHVVAVAREIGSRMRDYKVVVNKSTVPVGTADRVRQVIRDALIERGEEIDFEVVSNPEFLKEGKAVSDFMRPDRIIVGSDDEAAADLIAEAYAPLNRNHDRVMRMSIRSAELTKYAANAMLATRISFMNELANLSEAVGADIEEIRQGIGSDSRIGFDFLYAGCGFGGSCFPKDVRALGHTTREALGRPFRILEAVAAVNDAQKRLLFDKVSRYFDGELEGKRVGVWGLSFKPDTDDMREATSRVLIEALVGAGARVAAYDPAAMEQARRCFAHLEGIELVDSPQQALDNADALTIVTEWREFRAQDFGRLRSRMRRPVVFDGRNLYDPRRMAQLGFHYEGIGRPGSGRDGDRSEDGPVIP